ncbi:MAG: TetR/AcrR family transcriptional regulator [Selenomonadaceae bacterium]|nr:TetR/AcrR family transcriptional regulator [Selenomonadaceae bacterium]MDY2686202.1 TetR/AcrR family transcriptional regulator [Selenomonadaceae bacterium]
MEDKKMGRRERNKIRSRQAILDAAAAEFKRKGFKETAIVDIMRTAKLGTGTFYNYFKTKDGVLLALLSNLVQDMEHTFDSMRAEGKSSLDLLQAGNACMGAYLDENRYVLPLFIAASEHAGAPDGAMGDLHAPGFKPLYSRIIQDGQARGEIRQDIPADLIAELFHSIFQAAAFSQLRIPFQENIRLKTMLVVDGIREA